MTWDQDQVDSFMKSYNWTNFEQKSCRMNTSNIASMILLVECCVLSPTVLMKFCDFK